MTKGKLFAWAVVVLNVAVTLALIPRATAPPPTPALSTFLFWVGLLALVELLPIYMGFGAQVTMAFPVYLALLIVFRDELWVAVLISALGAFDARELRREIALWRALFNRSQTALSVAAAGATLAFYGGDIFSFPLGAFFVGLAAVVRLVTNFGFVAALIHLDLRQPYGRVVHRLLPEPIVGFALSYILLTALGVVTALAYLRLGSVAVAGILIPLAFARLSILGARAQQEAAEKLQEQQQALLESTERVFQERENERNRIAAELHDSSLQLLAAAGRGCENAGNLLADGRVPQAEATIRLARDAIGQASKELRESLRDLRESSVSGGLVNSISNYADQLATLWGGDVKIEASLTTEPPTPVALAAFQIFQEGLINALKHAGSDEILVRVSDDGGHVHVVVEDRGQGFQVDQEVGGEHLGMRLMKERAARAGGRLELESSPGSGTRVEAILPGGISE